MKPEIVNLKNGDKVTITHSRKGTFNAEVTSNDENSEWLGTTILDKKVKGLVNEWIPGEALNVRKTLITNIKMIES